MLSPSDFLMAAKRCELGSLEHLQQMASLVGSIGQLVHELQRERGASNVFLGSGGAQFAEQRAQVVALALSLEQEVRGVFAGLDSTRTQSASSMRLFNRVAMALLMLDGLPALRGRIEMQRMRPADLIPAFSEVIASLLAVVVEAVDAAGDPAISRLLVALFHLMQGKELAGQERASGVAAFSGGRLNQDGMAHLLHLIEGEERCFEIFLEFCGPQTRQRWLELNSDTTMLDVERMRRTLIASSGNLQPDHAAALRWFELCTRRLDAMREIEQALADDLSSLCAEKIAAAQADLSDQASLLERIEKAGPLPAAAFAVFMEDSPDTGADKLRPMSPMLNASGFGPQLGSSIVDMLQAQARRIQEMTDELNKARTTLKEHKVVERATGLLMARRGLTEEQAHRLLRQTAMNQNRRLIDIAESTLSLIDLIPDTPVR